MRRKEREVTEIEEIEEIINKSDVCRIAFSDGNMPYIVTMNFGYEGNPGRLYFHCATEGKKIDMIRRNSYVCFEMDTDHQLYGGNGACDWGMNYKSVVGYGNISVLNEMEARKTGMASIMDHYTHRKEYEFDNEVFGRTVILMLEITEMTGKKC